MQEELEKEHLSQTDLSVVPSLGQEALTGVEMAADETEEHPDIYDAASRAELVTNPAIDKMFVAHSWRALEEVTSNSGFGLYASDGVLFKGAVFGRDQCESDLSLLELPAVALQGAPRSVLEQGILTLAAKQGLRTRDINDEQEGRILHEYRSSIVDGKPLGLAAQALFNALSEQWGGDEQEVTYYGSIDSTPLYLKVIGEYIDKFGDDILNSTVIRESVEKAADWVIDRLKESPMGLLMHQTRNKTAGQNNQAWKDSQEAYIHEDGSDINHAMPVASTEVQGYVYDGLKVAERLIPVKSQLYAQYRKRIQQVTLDQLWMPDKQYPAMGMDYDEVAGKYRQIASLNANAAQLLDSDILLDLPEEIRERYVTGIVKMIKSKEFLTDGGLRSRALSHANLVPFWDYHGSRATWPKETHAIARGLHRHGLHKFGEQLDARVYNVIKRACLRPDTESDGGNRLNFMEFFYVDDDGKLLLELGRDTEDAIRVEGTIIPDAPQTWTIASVLAAGYAAPRQTKANSWQARLETEVMRAIKIISFTNDPDKLRRLYPPILYKVWNSNPYKSTFWIDELHQQELVAEARQEAHS